MKASLGISYIRSLLKEKDSPWDITKKKDGREGGVIPRKLIQNYFKELFFSDQN